MQDLTEKFKYLYREISTDSFLKMESLGGEIPFHIADYDAKQELAVQRAIQLLKKKLTTNGISVLELNLFDTACELIEQHGGMDKIFRVEQKRGKDKFIKAMQSTLNMHRRLMPALADKIAASNAKVFFLTGIGQVFPFIRSHNVLNNLQNIAKSAPTVIFFPGVYNGNNLNLFGLMKDDNYYRAFPMKPKVVKQ